MLGLIMRKLYVVSGFTFFLASTVFFNTQPSIAGCGWGDITCNPKNWTCPVGGCPPIPRLYPAAGVVLQKLFKDRAILTINSPKRSNSENLNARILQQPECRLLRLHEERPLRIMFIAS